MRFVPFDPIALRAAALRRQLDEDGLLGVTRRDVRENFAGDVIAWLGKRAKRRLALRRAYAIGNMVKAGWSIRRIRQAFPILSVADVKKARAVLIPDPYAGEVSCGSTRGEVQAMK